MKKGIFVIQMLMAIAAVTLPPFLQADIQTLEPFDAISLLGERLIAPAPGLKALENYEQAKKKWQAEPSEENTIWYGRRAAYLGRYREAIILFGDGLAKYPDSYRLLRHRGHRWITVRQFTRAVADLEKAAALVKGKPLESEPDGIPNRLNRPLANTQMNIYYHLGLAHYLSGDYSSAEKTWRECLKWCNNDDLLVVTSDWLYLTYRFLKREKEAEGVLESIPPRMKLVENEAYHRRLLMYKGLVAPESLLAQPAGEGAAGAKFAISGYGLGCRSLWQGETNRAMEMFSWVTKEADFAQFGAIASEVELSRLLLDLPLQRSPVTLLRAWLAFWNLYDLSALERLFSAGNRVTYISSEKNGRITGIEALRQHHVEFGFVPGGKVQEKRLWLEEVHSQPYGDVAVVTASWFFNRDYLVPEKTQKGPATFVIVREGEGWRITHAHFGNWK